MTKKILGTLLFTLLPAMPQAIAAVPELEQLNARCVEQLDRADAPDVREVCANASYEAARVAPGSAEHATSLNNLALLYERRGKFDEAERLYQMSLTYFEQALGASHPDLAQSLENLAGFYRGRGRETEAAALAARARTLRDSAPPSAQTVPEVAAPSPPPPATEARAGIDLAPSRLDKLNEQCVQQYSRDDFKAADKNCQFAVDQAEKYAPGTTQHASSLNNLAGLNKRLGDYKEAETLYRQALRIWEQAQGPDSPDVGVSLNNLANLHAQLGRYPRAAALYERTLAIWTKSLGADHPQTQAARDSLSAVRSRMQK